MSNLTYKSEMSNVMLNVTFSLKKNNASNLFIYTLYLTFEASGEDAFTCGQDYKKINK